MDNSNTCRRCGKNVENESEYCMDCMVELEIKNTEMKMEM